MLQFMKHLMMVYGWGIIDCVSCERARNPTSYSEGGENTGGRIAWAIKLVILKTVAPPAKSHLHGDYFFNVAIFGSFRGCLSVAISSAVNYNP
jgi:hypothetical protein